MYFIYILLCTDNSLYTGITNNLEKRMEKHASGKGAKYVRAHLPFTLIYNETHETKSDALRREREIKSWSRQKKIKDLNLNITEKKR